MESGTFCMCIFFVSFLWCFLSGHACL